MATRWTAAVVRDIPLLVTPAVFDYRAAPVPVPDDIVAAHARAWERLRRAGAWWTGAERIEIAAEVRNAFDCACCRERKAALSPNAVTGTHHATAARLDAVAVDAVHRIVTDAPRLSQAWVDGLAAHGLTDGHYVELLGVVVTVLSVDEVHRGLGIPLAALPAPLSGAPSGERPSGLQAGSAWVPILPLAAAAAGPHADLYAGLPVAPNVLSAMSLVPDAVRQLQELSAVHYLPQAAFTDPHHVGRALERRQIELVAGRVSALNECFY